MNKVVVVTGAGRGLGFSVVKKHIALKDTIYAFDYQITDELKKLADEYPALKYYLCDISQDKDVSGATSEILTAEKHLDYLYNIAGIFIFEERVGLAETSLDKCMLMFNINALGAVRITKALWPLLGKGSVVVNVTSESGSVGAMRRVQEYGYSMSKSAENMFSKILSNELWEKEARVMCFHPGWLRTPMGGPAAFESDRSVSPDVSAGNIVNTILDIDKIPRDQMYMQHTGEILPW
ncbi:MAG: SDR family NAD(P)-dependent oxidoreductase [Treponema sp.]|nr:SDR family NAD(P)-dependent oxidoreductase [Treponema sp.]